LNIKHTRIAKPKSELSVSTATSLAIGTSDGFDVSDNADFVIEKTHSLVCKPDGATLKLTDPNIPTKLLLLLNALIDHMSASVSAVSVALTQFHCLASLSAHFSIMCNGCCTFQKQHIPPLSNSVTGVSDLEAR
jgi:hypothetical protein